MFNFTMKQPTATTVASTTPNSTFTFNPSTVSQPRNVFGTSNTSQPFIFTGGVQNTPSIGPFSNSLSNSSGTSVFGTNQSTPAVQPTNTFPSNLTGTTIKFNPVSSQELIQSKNQTVLTINVKLHCICAMKEYLNKSMDELRMEDYQANRKYLFVSSISGSTNLSSAFATFPSAPTTANIFGGSNNNTAAAAASPFGTTMFNTPSGPFSTAPIPSANPFNVGSSTAQPSTFNPTANANTSVQFKFGPQPNASTNVFPQPTTTTPFNNTVPFSMTNPFNTPTATTTSAATMTPAMPGLSSIASTSGTSNIFPGLAPSTTTALPTVNNFFIQPTVPTTTSLSFPSSTSTLLSSQTAKQEQKTEQTTSIIQQNFLAASLLDPYANRGKKDFSNINQIQAPAESNVVSTVSTSTTTTSTPIPVTLPIQSNLRKVAPSRSLVDVNFKLRPVSSSPTLNEDIKPSNQPSTVSTEPVKSRLAGHFTDEEELVLLGRTKMSKLRISNDIIDGPSQTNSIRSLYPVRRLAELEKFASIIPRASTPPPPTKTTVYHERTSHSANNSRDVSPDPRFTPSVNPKQSSSPIIQRKSNYSNNQNYRLPILTRENYYMKPSASDLKSFFNDKGQCILKQFTVGHEIYGSVTFYGQINVAGLNLDEIIEIKRHEVTVYPDDDRKPPVGEELNVPARITLFDVYPIDRTTREEITDIERIKAANYNDHLREITKKFDGEFINYDMTDGSWTFMVKHFTWYGLDDDQDGFVIQS